MANLPTFDFETEADAIKRKQAIADALQQSSLAPMQMPTTPGARLSPLNGMAKLLEAYVAGKKGDEAKAERGALSQRYGDELRTGMEQYYKTSQGYDAPSMVAQPGGDGTPQSIRVPGDRKKAIFDALASNHPVLRDLAMKQLAEEGKNQLTPKDLLGIATPESVLANTANPASWKPKRELKAVAPGEVMIDAAGNFAEPGNPRGTAPWQTRTIGGDLYQQTATGLKKLDNSPKVNVNTNVVNKGEGKFMEGLGTKTADDVMTAKAAKVEAQRTLQTVAKLEALDAQGVYSGPQANLVMTLGSFADGLGMRVDSKKLGTSQAYQGEVMGQLANQLTGSLARSTTDKDMEILKAPLPQLLNTAEGRAALRRQMAAKAQEKIAYADAVQANLEQEFPEAGRMLRVTPGNVAVPQRTDLGGMPSPTIKWGDLP